MGEKIIAYSILDSASQYGSTVVAVAVEGDVEDWACYVGVTSAYAVDADALQHIAARGTKTSREVGEALFPNVGLRWRP